MPGDVVSMTNAIFMRQVATFYDQVSHVFAPFPSLSCPEGLVNQANKPNSFLLLLPISFKAPGK